MDSPSQRINHLQKHSFFFHIEEIGLFTDIPEGSVTHIDLGGRDGAWFPTVDLRLGEAPQEDIDRFDRTNVMIHYTRNLLETLRRVDLTLTLINKLEFELIEKITTPEFLHAIETASIDETERIRESVIRIDFEEKAQNYRLLKYYVANYFMRIPTILEQLYRVLNALLYIGFDFRKPIRQFERLLAGKESELWAAITEYKDNSWAIKKTRNTIAHLDEFQDEKLDGMDELLEGTLRVLERGRYSAEIKASSFRQYSVALCKYKEDFLILAANELHLLFSSLEKIFNIADKITSQEYNVLRANHIIE